MAYDELFKEGISVKNILAKTCRLIPYIAYASLKIWILFIVINALALASLLFVFGENSGFTAASFFCTPIIALMVHYIFGYSAVKIAYDGANDAKQEIFGAILLTFRKLGPIVSASAIIAATGYFIFSPAIYLQGAGRGVYIGVICLAAVLVLPLIILYPWFIMLDNKGLFDSFKCSCDMVKKNYLKYVLLFCFSAVVIILLTAVFLLALGAAEVLLNFDSCIYLWRLSQSMSDAIPLNIKMAVLFMQIPPLGLKFTVGVLFCGALALYIVLLGQYLLTLILAVIYKSLKDYRLLAENPVSAHRSEEILEKEFKELAVLFKDVKEITIDTKEEDFEVEEGVDGHLDRREALRRFNKNDDDSEGSIKPIIHEYPDPKE